MNNVLLKKWFSANPRTQFKSFVQDEMKDLNKTIVDYNFYNQDDYVYKSAVMGGLVVCFNYLNHLCVDTSSPKPWIIRKRFNHILDLKDFKRYSEEVVMWLNKQPPSINYSALVHTQTINAFLTTMEYKDGPSDIRR